MRSFANVKVQDLADFEEPYSIALDDWAIQAGKPAPATPNWLAHLDFATLQKL